MEILIVAKWWDLDPDIVGSWVMPDFLDRQEYMFIQMDLEHRNIEQDDEPEYWEGRK